jgi:hypothetical protein
MIYQNKNNDELIVSCDCGCGKSLLWQAKQFDDEDEGCYVSLVEHSWYAKQDSKLKSYFKRLWKALRGREYCLTELVLKKEEIKEFTLFLNRLTEKLEEKGETQ